MFNKEFDKNLWIILEHDSVNRDIIIKLLNETPNELIESAKEYLENNIYDDYFSFSEKAIGKDGSTFECNISCLDSMGILSIRNYCEMPGEQGILLTEGLTLFDNPDENNYCVGSISNSIKVVLESNIPVEMLDENSRRNVTLDYGNGEITIDGSYIMAFRKANKPISFPFKMEQFIDMSTTHGIVEQYGYEKNMADEYMFSRKDKGGLLTVRGLSNFTVSKKPDCFYYVNLEKVPDNFSLDYINNTYCGKTKK